MQPQIVIGLALFTVLYTVHSTVTSQWYTAMYYTVLYVPQNYNFLLQKEH